MLPIAEKVIDGKVCRQIPDWPAYWVSETGEVWSEIPRHPAMWLKLGEYKCYRRCSLMRSGKRGYFEVKNLVALAFIGPKPFPRALVCHKDGNNQNDHFSNLYYGTYQQNANDRALHGNTQKGSARSATHWLKKLTPEQVRDIYIRAVRETRQLTVLAAELGITSYTIRNIYNKNCWVWLTDAIDEEMGWNTEEFQSLQRALRKRNAGKRKV